MRRWAAGFDDIFPPVVWSDKQKVIAELIGGILEVTDEEEGPLLRLLLGLARSVYTCYTVNTCWLTQSWSRFLYQGHERVY